METNKEDWEGEFVEKGADLEHARWSKWQDYVFSKCEMKVIDDKAYMCLPNEFYQRWARQIDTPYSELSEAEKESDRKEVRQYLPLIQSLLSTQEEKIFKQFETIDVKMGDPDAEAKVKFAIKAMVRHIKLKNATK